MHLTFERLAILICVLLVLGGMLWIAVVSLMAWAILHPPRMSAGKAIYHLRRLSPGDLGLPFEDRKFPGARCPLGIEITYRKLVDPRSAKERSLRRADAWICRCEGGRDRLGTAAESIESQYFSGGSARPRRQWWAIFHRWIFRARRSSPGD